MSLGDLAHDTIAAIATPPGLSALAVVRVAGPRARDIVSALAGNLQLKPRQAHHCRLQEPDSSDILDDAVLTWFKAPDSYSGDDIVEISCHGGFYSADAVLQALLRAGARMALAGEFTQRAFLNGKLDLLQVEAVADIIHGQSRRQHELAEKTLKGDLSKQLRKIKDRLITAASRIELELDFSDQEIEKSGTQDILDLILPAREDLQALSEGYHSGRVIREGLSIALAGRPNAGKSTLLNLLLKEDRAITSQTPGTTRDTIEESFQHRGHLFKIVDTAGLRESEDLIESEGIRRSYAAIEEADLLVLLLDSSSSAEPLFETRLLQRFAKPRLLVFTKTDLPGLADRDSFFRQHFPGEDVYFANLKDPSLRDPLLEALCDTADRHFGLFRDSLGISRLRHREHISRAIDDLLQAENALRSGISGDLVSIDLRSAIHELDALSGETRSEDILNRIFSDFCIGK